jgi:DNA-binding response OmpR family regulator
LRKKLGDDAKDPHFIRTVRSVGYIFGDPPSPEQKEEAR